MQGAALVAVRRTYDDTMWVRTATRAAPCNCQALSSYAVAAPVAAIKQCHFLFFKAVEHQLWPTRGTVTTLEDTRKYIPGHYWIKCHPLAVAALVAAIKQCPNRLKRGRTSIMAATGAATTLEDTRKYIPGHYWIKCHPLAVAAPVAAIKQCPFLFFKEVEHQLWPPQGTATTSGKI